MLIPSDKTQDQLQNGSTCNGDEVPTELAVKPPRTCIHLYPIKTSMWVNAFTN